MNPKKIIETLEPYMTDGRIETLQDVVNNRTKTVLTVLENPYDAGNVNAAMRSAEAFGFQDFHIIGSPSRLKPAGRTSAGAGKWLTVNKWTSTTTCFEHLKNHGYLLVGMSGEATKLIDEVDFSKKTALVFGSEHAGLSDEADKLVDLHVKIPTVGMVESFNLSVAVAISLYGAFVSRGKNHSDLTKQEKDNLLAEYYLKSVPYAQRILDSSL